MWNVLFHKTAIFISLYIIKQTKNPLTDFIKSWWKCDLKIQIEKCGRIYLMIPLTKKHYICKNKFISVHILLLNSIFSLLIYNDTQWIDFSCRFPWSNRLLKCLRLFKNSTDFSVQLFLSVHLSVCSPTCQGGI